MAALTLTELLERNARHVAELPDAYFSRVEHGQEPPVVSICCADSRVSQEGMFQVERPGELFTPSTIGNQVWDRYRGELIVDGSVLYPMVQTDTQVTTVVGHTGCGAISAALEAVQTDHDALPLGIAKWVELLTPVIEDGLADDRVDPEADASLVDQLVEYNVDRQVAFLLESDDVPDDETIYGFVYDFLGVYGETRGRTYLVNAGGETDLDALRDLVPNRFADAVQRLL